MNITIIGGGNLGTALAGEFATKGHKVVLYSSKACIFSSQITIVEDDGKYLSKPFKVTDDLQYALSEETPQFVIITIPANGLNALAVQMLPYIKLESVLLFMPGIGGVEYMFSEYIRQGIVMLGLQRIPAVYRIIEPGHSVRISGRRKNGLFMGAIPARCACQYTSVLSELFGMTCIALPNYLNVTLTPSNPILHTSRLYSMFRDYTSGLFYDRNFLFYQEWDNLSSEILLRCDSELQLLLTKIPELNLFYVKSLKEHYESKTAEELTDKISHIPSFAGITSPMEQIGVDKWIPDWNSRYFTADFPYGLAIIKGLAELFEAEVPMIDNVLKWYSDVTGQEYYEGQSFTGKSLKNTGVPQRYGYNSKESLLSLYQ